MFQHVVIDDRLAAMNQERLDRNLYVMKLTGTEIHVLTTCMVRAFTYVKYVFPRKLIMSAAKKLWVSPIRVDTGTFSTHIA